MASSGKRKFFGSIAELKAAVAQAAASGHWEERFEPPMHLFRATSGENINWWPRTGTIQFQWRISPEFVARVAEHLGEFRGQEPASRAPRADVAFLVFDFATR